MCVPSCPQASTEKNHSVPGEPCAHDPLTLCSLSCDSKEGQTDSQANSLSESLMYPGPVPQPPLPPSHIRCSIGLCHPSLYHLGSSERAPLSTAHSFFLLTPLSQPRRPSCSSTGHHPRVSQSHKHCVSLWDGSRQACGKLLFKAPSHRMWKLPAILKRQK